MRQCFVPGERVNKRKERSHKLERDNFALFQNKISNCANNIFFLYKIWGNSPEGNLIGGNSPVGNFFGVPCGYLIF